MHILLISVRLTTSLKHEGNTPNDLWPKFLDRIMCAPYIMAIDTDWAIWIIMMVLSRAHARVIGLPGQGVVG
jgi:hypothetical protein